MENDQDIVLSLQKVNLYGLIVNAMLNSIFPSSQASASLQAYKGDARLVIFLFTLACRCHQEKFVKSAMIIGRRWRHISFINKSLSVYAISASAKLSRWFAESSIACTSVAQLLKRNRQIAVIRSRAFVTGRCAWVCVRTPKVAPQHMYFKI